MGGCLFGKATSKKRMSKFDGRGFAMAPRKCVPLHRKRRRLVEKRLPQTNPSSVDSLTRREIRVHACEERAREARRAHLNKLVRETGKQVGNDKCSGDRHDE
jgi:hypothetical protein